MSSPRPRVMMKLSGEVLAGKSGAGLDAAVLADVATQLKRAVDEGARIAAVLGGGNIFRGLGEAARGMDRVTADQMGMLATVINGLALMDALRQAGAGATLFTAFPIGAVGAPYVRDSARAVMERHEVAILSAGTGNPFFSTDSAAALRAAELGCDVFMKGTKVDGVYDKDPARFADAIRFDTLSFDEMLERRLKVIDLTAATLCRENDIDLRVYRMTADGVIHRAALGEPLGSLITNR